MYSTKKFQSLQSSLAVVYVYTPKDLYLNIKDSISKLAALSVLISFAKRLFSMIKNRFGGIAAVITGFALLRVHCSIRINMEEIINTLFRMPRKAFLFIIYHYSTECGIDVKNGFYYNYKLGTEYLVGTHNKRTIIIMEFSM